jgi:hypothetical protein
MIIECFDSLMTKGSHTRHRRVVLRREKSRLVKMMYEVSIIHTNHRIVQKGTYNLYEPNEGIIHTLQK